MPDDLQVVSALALHCLELEDPRCCISKQTLLSEFFLVKAPDMHLVLLLLGTSRNK
jgi:hypothetical protein